MDDWLHVALAMLDHSVGTVLRRSVPLAQAAE
jgi:hypothetical protein